MAKPRPLRHLVLVLGDQLNIDSAVFDDFDPQFDAVWMAEASEESTHVCSSKPRIAIFLAAMRHFRLKLESKGFTVHYHQLAPDSPPASLASLLAKTVNRLKPRKLILAHPGDHRVKLDLTTEAASLGVDLLILPDRHFICSPDEFDHWADQRKELRLEYFYRLLRRKTNLLMLDDQPLGDNWNFDKENRASFSAKNPPLIAPPRSFAPDAITRDVIALVNQRFAKHPGYLQHFDWPLTAEQAHQAMDDFITHRLPHFGLYQDAMWTDQPWLYHSRLSAALNLHLLDPRTLLAAAEQAYHRGQAPLPAVEGFIRQILGWREFIRAIYWKFMPQYLQFNALNAHQPLPDFYWNANTPMHCLAQTLQQTLDLGYAHHIQRLMITGLYSLLASVHPTHIHHWYLAVYVDAVEWAELPNVLGMSQYADGGILASKPYIASGKYIDRMSNYCKHCPFDPAQSTGPDACPFTTLYWNFLHKHRDALSTNPRMTMQLKNLKRLAPATLDAIQDTAQTLQNLAFNPPHP